MRFQLGQPVVTGDRGSITGRIAARRLIEWAERGYEGEKIYHAEEAYKVTWDSYVGVSVNKGWYRLSELSPVHTTRSTQLEMNVSGMVAADIIGGIKLTKGRVDDLVALAELFSPRE